jgi:hypothetical protein
MVCCTSSTTRCLLIIISGRSRFRTTPASALIIEAGSWFKSNEVRENDSVVFRENRIELYKETIDELAPYFHRFIHQQKMKVFWVNLPPKTYPNASWIRLFGWDRFVLLDFCAD